MTNCACTHTAQFLKYSIEGALGFDFGGIFLVKVRLIPLVQLNQLNTGECKRLFGCKVILIVAPVWGKTTLNKGGVRG